MFCRLLVLVGVAFALAAGAGCGAGPPAAGSLELPQAQSDLEKVRTADFSILYVGNSHTFMHNLPGVIEEMIQYHQPGKTVYSHFMPVAFLEDIGRDLRYQAEIETRPWKYVVLQAQKESRSGRFQYSQAEGIDAAKRGKDRGAAVVFYSEWGLRDAPGHGARIEKEYQAMADASGARVAPVGRAWDLALAGRPDLALYDADGNHQAVPGAFLTACVLFGRLTGESPSALASFPFPGVGEADRKFLAQTAAQAIEPGTTGPQRP
jgi:hypothetical protein